MPMTHDGYVSQEEFEDTLKSLAGQKHPHAGRPGKRGGSAKGPSEGWSYSPVSGATGTHTLKGKETHAEVYEIAGGQYHWRVKKAGFSSQGHYKDGFAPSLGAGKKAAAQALAEYHTNLKPHKPNF